MLRCELATSGLAAQLRPECGLVSSARFLRLSLRAFGDRVEAWLQDDGLGVDVSLDAPLPPESAKRGRGVAIVRKMVDEFSYARIDGMNRWLIVKLLPDPG